MIGHRTERPGVSRAACRRIACAAMPRGGTFVAAASIVVAAAVAAGCTAASGGTEPPAPDGAAPARPSTPGAKLDHLIFIVQENRSFDQYFGTYPGANGIPTKPDGSFSVCVPDPFAGTAGCPPYVTSSVDQAGGPHTQVAAINDVNGGKMDGFIRSLPNRPTRCWVTSTLRDCAWQLGPQGQPDVMSTQPRSAIPNYWAYADHYVLQDR